MTANSQPIEQTVEWLRKSPIKLKVMMALSTPLTVNQIAISINKTQSQISKHLKLLSEKGLVRCLTDSAPHHRTYSLSQFGESCIKNLQSHSENQESTNNLDWEIYSKLSSRGRSSILQSTSTDPHSGSKIRKQANIDYKMKISANYSKVILSFLEKEQIVERDPNDQSKISLTPLGLKYKKALTNFDG